MSWTVYILQCADNTLYTGITKDLERRVQNHGTNKGAKYTRGRGPYKILFQESHSDKSSALKREKEIKSLHKVEKLKLAGRQK
jgi:putative endonuclease